MQAKPKHLATKYAEQFKDKSIVDAYHNRPAYADELFPFLAEMTQGEPKRVLDVGCGLGNIARPLALHVAQVDAVDFSKQMITQSRQLQYGDAPNLNWICSPIETAPVSPPYGLITAGQSLHWFDWDVALPRFAELLVPNGYLVIIDRKFGATGWDGEMKELIAQYSTNQEYQPYNLIDELEDRGLFEKVDDKVMAQPAFIQTVPHYIEAIHSANGFSRERMLPQNAQAFDDALEKLVWSYVGEDRFATAVSTHITWGYPKRP